MKLCSHIPDGEDLNSLNHHKKWMKREYGKAQYNKVHLRTLMDLTISLRDFPKQPLEDSFNEFLFLRDPYELTHEVQRKKNILMLMECEKFFTKVPLELKFNCSTIEDFLMALPSLTKEKIENIYLIEPAENITSPLTLMFLEKIQSGKTFIKVIAEQKEVFRCQEMVLGIAAFMALHSIFELQYSKKFTTFAALEILFGLPLSIKTTKRNFILLKKCLK